MTNWDEREVTLISLSWVKGKSTMYFVQGRCHASSPGRRLCEGNFLGRCPYETAIHLVSGGGFCLKLSVLCNGSETFSCACGKRNPFFYKKILGSRRIYIVSSDKVRDEALENAYEIIADAGEASGCEAVHGMADQ